MKLDVTYAFGTDEALRFVGFEPLGADDLRLLQGIIALSGPHGLLLTQAPVMQAEQQLRSLLDPKLDATNQDGLVVHGSMPKLLAEIGMTDGGDNIKALKASLLRMSNVTVLVTKGQRHASYHLMSHAFDEENGGLWIALNPRIAEAILGRRQYTRIDMTEVRALQTDPARLVHQRLCGWINQGKPGRVELDTLCSYVWPEAATNVSTNKKRHQSTRKALAELTAIGWLVHEYAKARFEISRPKSQAKPTKTA